MAKIYIPGSVWVGYTHLKEACEEILSNEKVLEIRKFVEDFLERLEKIKDVYTNK